MHSTAPRARTPRAVRFHKRVYHTGLWRARHLRAAGVKDDATARALLARMRVAGRAVDRAVRSRA